MLKKQNGITLVALVITIIVLLILAGVTISMVVGDNGILTRSKQSKFNTLAAEVDENVKMAVADLSAEFQVLKATNSAGTMTEDQVKDVINKTISSSDSSYTITATNGINNTGNGTITIKYENSDLKASATKDWNPKSLTYSIAVANYDITITSPTNTSGGY